MTYSRTLPQGAIDFIKAAGYRVFMRDSADSYAMFEGNGGVGYVQFEPWAGYTVATVHAPNKESGTGYQVARHVSELTEELLRQAVRTTVPHEWRSHKAPRKYASMEEYQAGDAWRAGYREV